MCFVLFWWVDAGKAPSIDDVHLFSVDFYIRILARVNHTKTGPECNVLEARGAC